jgi:hypothetical protein
MTVKQQSVSEASNVIRPLSAMAAAFILPLALLFAPNAHAQGKPLACQFQDSAGLDWGQGRWNVMRFVPKEPFILVLKGGDLDVQSVVKPLGGRELTDPVCTRSSLGNFLCTSHAGGTLMFNPSVNRGAVAQLLGGTSSAAERGSLTVSPFICQPY